MSHDLQWLLICKQLVEKQTYNNKNVFIAVTYVQGLYRIFLFLFQLAHEQFDYLINRRPQSENKE